MSKNQSVCAFRYSSESTRFRSSPSSEISTDGRMNRPFSISSRPLTVVPSDFGTTQHTASLVIGSDRVYEDVPNAARRPSTYCGLMSPKNSRNRWFVSNMLLMFSVLVSASPSSAELYTMNSYSRSTMPRISPAITSALLPKPRLATPHTLAMSGLLKSWANSLR